MVVRGKKRELVAVLSLLSASIGAGILALPYVAIRAYPLTPIIGLLAAVSIILTSIILVEIFRISEKRKKTIVHYITEYFDKKKVGSITLLFLMWSYCALAAYLIIIEKHFDILFGYGKLCTAVFLILATICIVVYQGMSIRRCLYLLGIPIILLVLFVSALGGGKEFFYMRTSSPMFAVFLYFVLVFSLTNFSYLTEIDDLIETSTELYDILLTVGIVSLILALSFAASVIREVGVNVDEIGTISLIEVGDPVMKAAAFLLATLAAVTSFLAIGKSLTSVLEYYFKFDTKAAVLAVVVPAAALYALGGRFLYLVVAGGIAKSIFMMLAASKFLLLCREKKIELKYVRYPLLSSAVVIGTNLCFILAAIYFFL